MSDAAATHAVELLPPAMLTSAQPRTRSTYATVVIAAAFVALCLKLAIAYNTLGTNDAVTFYTFARSLSDHGLKWTYERGVAWLPKGPIFNHPPMTAWYLEFIRSLSQAPVFQSNGFTFPFLLRLPGIVADFIVVIVLVAWSRRKNARVDLWSLGLLALSPVSVMVSGYHGNTDPVMVLFLFLAAYSCLTGKPWACGLFFALSCQVKIIPLLFFPIFLFYWMNRRALVSFLLPLALASVVMWWQPLTQFPTLFVKNVLSYGSYWGLWGISYCLRSTGAAMFNSLWFNFSSAQTAIATMLKLTIVAGVALIAWRRRTLSAEAVMESIALGWIVFFVFSPGVCAQYLVWPAPFLLFAGRKLFIALTAASSVFLFAFYNVISHGLPWYVGVSTNNMIAHWAPWALPAWAVFGIALVCCWRKIVLGTSTFSPARA